jgi:hypothetical protein
MNDIKTINMGETLDLNIHCETLTETNDEENSQTSDLGSEEELESMKMMGRKEGFMELA